MPFLLIRHDPRPGPGRPRRGRRHGRPHGGADPCRRDRARAHPEPRGGGAERHALGRRGVPPARSARAIDWLASDGGAIAPGQTLCRLNGPARSLLTGERAALNFLQTLSGTATLARRWADAVAGTGARILDTRKTIPGLRLAQKYAVTCGGCHNHRIGLYDAMLIKENHIAAAGSVTAALHAAVASAAGLEIEIEVETLEQLREALAAGARRILLDNFPLEGLREAVAIAARRARLEASGGSRSTPCARSPRRASTTSRSARSPRTCARSTCRCASTSDPRMPPAGRQA